MKLLYPQEHLTCKNYVSDFHIGFSNRSLQKNEVLADTDKFFNHIFFFQEGNCMISCNEFRNNFCKGGEMIFIPQDAEYSLNAMSDLNYVQLSFDNQFTLCEELSWETLRKVYDGPPVLNKIEIRYPLQQVLDSVKFYLQHKIQCKHLHAIKQKEIFLIFRTFYTKMETAHFLSPMLNKDMNFKAFVVQHYQDVKTVEELAALCKMSTRSFSRKFSDTFGDSPYSWMLKQRSRHIKTKLADIKISFGSIIKQYGFSSPAHFTTYCKKQFGDTPSKLRKELLSDTY